MVLGQKKREKKTRGGFLHTKIHMHTRDKQDRNTNLTINKCTLRNYVKKSEKPDCFKNNLLN